MAAFQLVANPTFRVEVALSLPGHRQGQTIQVTFRHKGRREQATWRAAAHRHVKDDAGWLDEVIADWAGPVDKAGQPVPYSRAALAELLDTYPASGEELLAAYLREYRPGAVGEARAGN